MREFPTLSRAIDAAACSLPTDLMSKFYQPQTQNQAYLLPPFTASLAPRRPSGVVHPRCGLATGPKRDQERNSVEGRMRHEIPQSNRM